MPHTLTCALWGCRVDLPTVGYSGLVLVHELTKGIVYLRVPNPFPLWCVFSLEDNASVSSEDLAGLSAIVTHIARKCAYTWSLTPLLKHKAFRRSWVQFLWSIPHAWETCPLITVLANPWSWPFLLHIPWPIHVTVCGIFMGLNKWIIWKCTHSTNRYQSRKETFLFTAKRPCCHFPGIRLRNNDVLSRVMCQRACNWCWQQILMSHKCAAQMCLVRWHRTKSDVF